MFQYIAWLQMTGNKIRTSELVEEHQKKRRRADRSDDEAEGQPNSKRATLWWFLIPISIPQSLCLVWNSVATLFRPFGGAGGRSPLKNTLILSRILLLGYIHTFSSKYMRSLAYI